ncbi:MAG: nitroreductase family deazaflavin-dependent oxidoreductase [Acidobacteria bacterium]|nr:nitroreductase family deazaflavin-dependent oxidoreductase [Acidobacteriota bacterium]
MNDITVKYLSAVHAALYRATGGLIGRRLVRNDMCLLTTTGRRTGKRHTVPLLYLRNGDSVVVIASYGGRRHHPQWYQNLLAEPAAELQILDKRFQVTARTAEAAERAQWWPRIVDAYSDYAVYQSRTNREIPVVFLTPGNVTPAE